ncbi:uncharacterized protein LOC129766394 [Toxorhynchites rutilus septentrionalis]|uniref:uncharacterized protein LOC129766394 n=1 Tax=Toxorhynchites rutilus septentrionalis TaxID=329112 RepID=UPI00247AABDC|nr:uncharacterized protein LOC129766394 [Toxorhynchites rutilus septentrionalis]
MKKKLCESLHGTDVDARRQALWTHWPKFEFFKSSGSNLQNVHMNIPEIQREIANTEYEEEDRDLFDIIPYISYIAVIVPSSIEDNNIANTSNRIAQVEEKDVHKTRQDLMKKGSERSKKNSRGRQIEMQKNKNFK